MEQKKSFFASLDSKSALIVGLVAGILVICTIGFLVMLGLYFKGNKKADISDVTSPVATNQPTQPSQPAAPVAVTKSDRPKVELFVMSYCPYGLQMEKAYLPAWNLLKNNGIMIFDDYLWMPDIAKTLRPQMAIDHFIEVFHDYCEVRLNDYRKAIVKKI